MYLVIQLEGVEAVVAPRGAGGAEQQRLHREVGLQHLGASPHRQFLDR